MNLILYGLSGLMLGSFFNVVTTRGDWYRGRSRCDSCGHTLAWYDLAPVASYFLLRGRCRYCKEKIGRRHLICELMCGAGYLVLGYAGMTLDALPFLAVHITAVCLSFNAVSDYNARLTYTYPIYGSCAAVLILQIFLLQPADGQLMAHIALYLSTAALFLSLGICAHRYIGGGDLDILFLILLSGGVPVLLKTLFIASAAATLLYLPLLMLHKIKRRHPIPLATLLFCGYILQLLI